MRSPAFAVLAAAVPMALLAAEARKPGPAETRIEKPTETLIETPVKTSE